MGGKMTRELPDTETASMVDLPKDIAREATVRSRPGPSGTPRAEGNGNSGHQDGKVCRKAILECPGMEGEDNPVPEKRTEKKYDKKLKTERGVSSWKTTEEPRDKGSWGGEAGVAVLNSVYAADAGKDEAAHYPRERGRVP